MKLSFQQAASSCCGSPSVRRKARTCFVSQLSNIAEPFSSDVRQNCSPVATTLAKGVPRDFLHDTPTPEKGIPNFEGSVLVCVADLKTLSN